MTGWTIKGALRSLKAAKAKAPPKGGAAPAAQASPSAKTQVAVKQSKWDRLVGDPDLGRRPRAIKPPKSNDG